MSAIEKTKNLTRADLPIDKIYPNPDNPNEMSEAGFNMLYDNIEEMGVTDPILVVPHPEDDDGYMLIGGEHRWEVAKLLGFEAIPATIVDREDFDEDKQKFQIVRHNIIHGKMSPKKFLNLYKSLQNEYSEEAAAELFGFTEEEEFRKMISATRATLPDDMKSEFDKGAKDIKTMQDLSNLLNHLFANYGDTLEWNYMVVDYGGKKNYWLRMMAGGPKAFESLASKCKEANRSVDEIFNALMGKAVEDEEFMQLLIDATPERPVPDEMEIPSLDFMDQM